MSDFTPEICVVSELPLSSNAHIFPLVITRFVPMRVPISAV